MRCTLTSLDLLFFRCFSHEKRNSVNLTYQFPSFKRDLKNVSNNSQISQKYQKKRVIAHISPYYPYYYVSPEGKPLLISHISSLVSKRSKISQTVLSILKNTKRMSQKYLKQIYHEKIRFLSESM